MNCDHRATPWHILYLHESGQAGTQTCSGLLCYLYMNVSVHICSIQDICLRNLGSTILYLCCPV